MEFAKIYNTYCEKIYRVCLGYINDPETAKDMTQETFIAVWQSLDSFRNESAVGTWIYRIATNKCLRSIQRERKQTDLPMAFPIEESTSEEQDEKLVFLRKCLSELPEMNRIIISLYMEDLPQEEIAEITGLTHANVRVKVHRIKERLLKKFEENGKL